VVTAAEVPPALRSWLDVVGEIARAVNAAVPVDAVLSTLAERACALIGFDCCSVMLADPGCEHLRVAGSAGLSRDYVALVNDTGSLLIRPDDAHLDSPAAEAYRAGRTVAVPDVLTAARYGRLQHLAPAQGYRALIAAPLHAAAPGALGVIVGYSEAAREFSDPEVELVELLAAQAALACETARLRHEQQGVITELSRANTELHRSRARADWAERQHRMLMRLVLDDGGLPGLVDALAMTLDASVTVEDRHGHVLARAPDRGYHPPPDGAARRRDAQEPAGRHNEVVEVRTERAGRPGASAVGHPPGPAPGSWMAPVVIGGELAARLWVTNPRAAPEPVERRVIERFALVVAFEVLKQRQRVDVEERLSGDLISDLLHPGGPQHPRGVLDRAAALGHDLTSPHVLAVLTLDPPGPAPRLTDVVRAAVGAGTSLLVGPHEGAQVLLLPAVPGGHDEHLRSVLSAVGQAFPGRTATMAVAAVVHDVTGHSAAYRVARGAVRLRSAAQPGGLVDVGDLGLAALLLEAGTPQELRRFAGDLLRPVVDHETVHGGDLLATLRVWLAAGGSVRATAQTLVVHPNTVTYRLAGVARLTGRSLRRSDARLDLQLALTVHDIAGLDGP
jgi:sugar diacid utilization regulator/GAF domain-containing protein